jgi:hypothetical protein
MTVGTSKFSTVFLAKKKIFSIKINYLYVPAGPQNRAFSASRPDSSRSNNCSNYEITGSRAVLENSEIHYSCT